MRHRTFAALLVAVAFASGCTAGGSGSTKFDGERKAVADVVGKLSSAGEQGDARVVCEEVLAPALGKQIGAGRENCEAEMGRALVDADDFELTVQGVTIKGDSATAQVRGRDRVRTLGFERGRDGWRVTDLDA